MPLDPSGLKEQFRKSKKARRAWSTYKWFDRIRNWQDWYNWIASFLQTKAGAAVALGSTVVATTTAVVVHNTVVDPYAAPFVQTEIAPLPPAEPERQTRTTLIFAIEGYDKSGRRGTFDVVVAKKQFLWVRGSSDNLEKDGRVISGDELARDVLDQEVRDGLSNAREIVAVGTASQEGNPAEELARAGRRALRTAEIVKGAVQDTVPISALNLGQYREPCPTCDGKGQVKTPRSVCYDILREILREARQFNPKEFRVVASAAVVEMLLDEESQHLAGLCEFIGKPVSLRTEPGLSPEQYDIVLL